MNYKNNNFKVIKTRPWHIHTVFPEIPASHWEAPRTILKVAQNHGKDAVQESNPRLPEYSMSTMMKNLRDLGSQNIFGFLKEDKVREGGEEE